MESTANSRRKICIPSDQSWFVSEPGPVASHAPELAEHVRKAVQRALTERFAGADRIEFSSFDRKEQVWEVEGTCDVPYSSYPGSVVADGSRPCRFDGTVTVGPGHEGRTSFAVSIRVTADSSPLYPGLGGHAPSESLHTRTPNDRRSDVFNPTSAEHRAAANNRSNQMNRNNPAYHKSRGKK